jgi:hypothetical protein
MDQVPAYIGGLIAVVLILMGSLYTVSGFFRYAAAIDLLRRFIKNHREYPVFGIRMELMALSQIAAGIALLLLALFILNW